MAIQPVIQPKPIDRDLLQMDAYIRFIRMFISATLTVAKDQGVSLGDGALAPRPLIRSVFTYHSDGSVMTYTVPQDCFFVGCCGYAGELVVTNNGDSTAVIESGSKGLRPQVVGYWNTTGNSLGQRTPLATGQVLSMNVNSGPRVSLMMFELA